jgi:hypothetical protein
MARRHVDERHWLDKGRYAYPLFIAIGTVIFINCGGGSGAAPAPENRELTLDANRWVFAYSPGMPVHPEAGIRSFSFMFPQSDGVHYLLTGYNGSLVGMDSITVAVVIEANPVTVWEYGLGPNNPCLTPASVRVMLQRPNDDMVDANGRWWAVVGLRLQPGGFALTTPLTPESWSNVYGHRGDEQPEAFMNTLERVGNIGLTFGGGCFYGHGVHLSSGGRDSP